ncbi:triacylglycerol lipase [Chloropicon primus]|uniref:Triacylglycerol lipase n=2 Tax=Chloropicon primus TaxID=1764295 RepID=A0A5B8MBE8_9CHLO|nr:triacylglycerol lipase [Chloropicon primus]|eukprot:QDZ17736.1 triacylglycerol lipase [Chloropicon primus]
MAEGGVPAPEGRKLTPQSQLKEFGKSILAAALLGRWEEIFFRLTTLSRLLAKLAVAAMLRRKTKVEAWLGAPVISLSSPPTRWAKLWIWLPLVPFGRRALLTLLKVKRWQVLLASAGATWWAVHSARKAMVAESLEYRRAQKKLSKKVDKAETYAEWVSARTALETHEGKSQDARARWDRETSLYDRELLQARLAHLLKIREKGDVAEMVYALRTDMLRNLGNMSNKDLYKDRAEVPKPIQDYIQEVTLQLKYVTHYEFPDFNVEDKLSFLRETRHAFGRTALVLSGGGSLGTFHVGVVKALHEQNLLPRVLSGSSVGALICAIVCTRTDPELVDLMEKFCYLDLSFFNNSSLPQILKHIISKGSLHDIGFLAYRLRVLLGDYTFQEAYERSGRVLNICVTAANTNEPPKLLNYLTAPNVVIWSAVAASSAFPFLFMPTDLLARNRQGEFVKYLNIDKTHCSDRRWRDGSLEEDLPTNGVSEMFNVNYFLVSQVNPHIVPWLALKNVFPRKLSYLIISEWKHRCQQLAEILPNWFPKHMFLVFCQRWEGDVTVYKNTSIMSYIAMLVKAAMNPTSYSLKVAIAEGQRNTWPKLAAIQANCAIEQTLDECMWELKKSVNNSMLKQRGRIPSWLNVDTISRENSENSLLSPSISAEEETRNRKGKKRDEIHIMQ